MRTWKILLIPLSIAFFGTISMNSKEVKITNFDPNTVLRFTNLSGEKLHVLFITEESYAKVLVAGGWGQKSFEIVTEIQSAVVGAILTAKIPVVGDLAAGAWDTVFKDVLGDLPAVALSSIALATIKQKDFFTQVQPRSSCYSYGKTFNKKNILKKIKSSFKRNSPPYNILLAIFPDKAGLPDLKEIVYAGVFDRKKYNTVQYDSQIPGKVLAYKVNPKTKVVTTVAEGYFAGVELDEEKQVQLSIGGESLLEGLLGKIPNEQEESRETIEDILEKY